MENKEPAVIWEHAKVVMAVAVMAPPVAFIFSYFYDRGLLKALGISYSDAPTLLTDHMRTSLVWLPYAIIFVAILAACVLLEIRINKGKSEKEMDEDNTGSTDNVQPPGIMSKIFRTVRWGIEAVLILIYAIFFILWALLGDAYPGTNMVYVGLAFGWLVLATWIVNHTYMRRRFSFAFRVVFSAWPLIPLLFTQWGQMDALAAKHEKPIHRIHFNDKPTVLDVNIVRTYGNWLLVHSKPDHIFWIKLDNVAQIDVLDKENFKGLLCLISKDSCH